MTSHETGGGELINFVRKRIPTCFSLLVACTPSSKREKSVSRRLPTGALFLLYVCGHFTTSYSGEDQVGLYPGGAGARQGDDCQGRQHVRQGAHGRGRPRHSTGRVPRVAVFCIPQIEQIDERRHFTFLRPNPRAPGLCAWRSMRRRRQYSPPRPLCLLHHSKAIDVHSFVKKHNNKRPPSF